MAKTMQAELAPPQDAMTVAAIYGHLGVLRDMVGAESETSANIGANRYSDGGAGVSIYPNGISGGGDNQYFRAPTWPEAFTAAYTWAQNRAPVAREKAIRRMALDIIDLTDMGECTVRALTRRGSYVASLADAACQRATEMSGNAPFRIEAVS